MHAHPLSLKVSKRLSLSLGFLEMPWMSVFVFTGHDDDCANARRA